MQQGIRSVMPQGVQAPMPGQAPMQGQMPPMQGMMPSQSGPKPGITAFVPSLVGLEIPQMLQIFADPNSPIPKNRVLAAITEKQKEMAARRSVQNQMAMQQNAGQQGTIADAVVAQAAPVMAAHGGEMRGYAGGGAVAFQDAGVVPPGLMNPDVDEDGLPRGKDERARIIDYNNKIRAAYEQQMKAKAATSPRTAAPSIEDIAGRMAGRRQLEQFYGPRNPEAYTPEMVGYRVSSDVPTAAGTRQGKSGIADLDIGPSMVSSSIAPPRPAPGTGLPRPQNRPQAAPATPLQQLGSAVEQTGTPAPDRLAEIESEGVAGIKALQDVIRQQGTVDPELMKLREAAYKSSQDIAARRESDRQAMLKAAGAPMSQSLFDNQEALFRMLGAMKGGKRIGDAFSSIGQEAGAIRGEQRKEMQRVQELGRQEQIAIDQLNQALADKRVADRSGDVNLQRQADLKVAEAQLKVTDLRSVIQKERATEADRAEQRRLTGRGQDIQQQTAREQMANAIKVEGIRAAAREGTGDIAQQRLALQQLKADPEYTAAMNKIKELSKAAGLSSSPTIQTAFRAAQQEAATIARRYGLTPQDVGAAGSDTAAPAGNDPLGIRK